MSAERKVTDHRHGLPVSPSRIAIEALGIAPEGAPSKVDGCCAMCGTHISVGDICAPLRISQKFVDENCFAAPGSKIICGACASLQGKDALSSTWQGVLSMAGARPFARWMEIKASLLDPPEPPFVAVYGTSRQQHMVWRAPISYSRELFYVRVGMENLLIRRAILQPALAASSRLRSRLEEDRAARKKPKRVAASSVIPHAFARLSSDLKDVAHGGLNPAILAATWAKEKPYTDDIALLRSLTLGETWAMNFVTYLGKAE